MCASTVTCGLSNRNIIAWCTAMGPDAEHADALVAHFVAVAEGAVHNVFAPPRGKAGHLGQFVSAAGGHDDPAGADHLVVELHRERAGAAVNRRHGAGDQPAAVAFDLDPPEPVQLGRWCAIAGQHVVHVTGGSVAGGGVVDDDDGLCEPAEGHRRAESGRTAADHGHVIGSVPAWSSPGSSTAPAHDRT